MLLGFLRSLILLGVLGAVGVGLFVFSGLYPVGADVPHAKSTEWLLETLRDRSIARSAAGIDVPDDIDSADRLLSGAADYNDMCAGCHRSPGVEENDLTAGLYPTPPDLTASADGDTDDDEEALRRRFWVIKHGIKASGMPAWGPTHSDERIWNMAVFLQRLPELTAKQYQILSARG